MQAQVVVRTKKASLYLKADTLVDMWESDSPLQLSRAAGIDIEEEHERHKFGVQILDECGNYVGSELPVVFDAPAKCRKARPCVIFRDEVIDLRKFLSSVFDGEIEIERKEKEAPRDEALAMAWQRVMSDFSFKDFDW